MRCWLMLLTAVLCACADDPPGLGEERIPSDEDKDTQRIIDAMKKKTGEDNPPGKVIRGAHGKSHGCVRGELSIHDGIPDELRAGVFMPGTAYRAWIRFSNNDGDVKPDTTSDARGMAIKLLDVPGEKILDGERDERTQDFSFVSFPVIATGTVKDFASLVEAAFGGNPLGYFFNPLDPHVGQLALVLASKKQHGNPLQIRYYSILPYRHGDGNLAVKYAVTPCSDTRDPVPDNPGDNHLRAALVKSLSSGEGCFSFAIQKQLDAAQQPIEDGSIEWLEKDSPFIEVGTVKIPSQTFDTPEQNTFCENLSINPWHALPQHQPLGGLNRARKRVYQELSAFRHEKNSVPVDEPED